MDGSIFYDIEKIFAPRSIREARTVRKKDRTLAIMDHNVSTINKDWDGAGPISKKQMELLSQNCKDFEVDLLDINHPDQGVVHVVGPEMGLTLPGTVVACGDSHTSTHGAFGAFALGIGTSEIEHVLATQMIRLKKSKNFLVKIDGKLSHDVSAKDLALFLIGKIGTDGAQGYVIEYKGETVSDLSMEGRMTLCNLCIEAGARAVLIAPDDTTFRYLEGKDFVPKGKEFNRKVEYFKTLKEVKEILSYVESNEGAEVTADLNTFDLVAGGKVNKFALSDSLSNRIIQGWDDVDLTMRHIEKIQEFEKSLL